jgi:hypothetical protein
MKIRILEALAVLCGVLLVAAVVATFSGAPDLGLALGTGVLVLGAGSSLWADHRPRYPSPKPTGKR